MRSPRRSAPHIYELLVVLSDVAPPTWRRLRISSGATLSRVVRVIAVAMGWPAGRPYVFSAGPLRYEGAGPTPASRRPAGNDVRLRQLLHDPGAELELEYGSGHPWHFVLRLEHVLPPNDQLVTPWCVSGAGNAPPVDVGGPWAYEEWRGEGGGAETELRPEPPSASPDASAPGDVADAATFRGLSRGFNSDWVNAQLQLLR